MSPSTNLSSSHNPKKRKLVHIHSSDDRHDISRILHSQAPHTAHDDVESNIGMLKKCGHNELTRITKFAEDIKSVLSGAEGLKFPSLHEAALSLSIPGICLPHPRNTNFICKDVEVSFLPPCRIELGWGLQHGLVHTSKNGHLLADLIVQMPSSFFLRKDYLGFQYLQKRGLYLSYLVSALKKAKRISDYALLYDYIDGDETRPIVLVGDLDGSPAQEARCAIRLIPAIMLDTFPIDTPAPFGKRVNYDTDAPPWSELAVRDDAYHLGITESLQQYGFIDKKFKDALILGNDWLSCRGFSTHLLGGGFGDREWALVQLLLIKTTSDPRTSIPLACDFADPFHLFKAVLKLILEIVDNSHQTSRVTGFPWCYSRDGIFFKMSNWSITALKHSALRVLSFENIGFYSQPHFGDGFENCPYSDVDLCVSFEVEIAQAITDISTTMMNNYNIKYSISEYCYHLLFKSLGDRFKTVTFIAPRSYPQKIPKTNSLQPKRNAAYNLIMLLTLDEKNSTRILDHGPDLEDDAGCAGFRGFWGEKAELRRFKNGRVMETVKWKPSPSPVEQIIDFVYRRMPIPFQSDIRPRFYDLKFDNFLEPLFGQSSTEHFQTGISEFDVVANSIRQLKDFPLGIRGITGVCPELRFTSVEPPTVYRGRFDRPLEFELELECCSMWPIDPEQRKRSELGLLLKLAADLEATGNFISIEVGRSDEGNNNRIDFVLDILTKRYYYFRMHLQHRSDDPVAQPTKLPKGDIHLSNETDSHEYFKQNAHLHANRIIQKCKKYRYFSPSARAIKKWFQSQLLASFFTEEILELFVAIAFNSHASLDIPSSTTCGFRRVIAGISAWDWRKRALTIPISRPFTDDEIIQIPSTTALQYPTTNGEISLSIVLAVENGCLHWIRHTVPRLVAFRMTQLAKEVHLKLTNMFVSPNIFVPNMKIFDFVIVLKSSSGHLTTSKTYSNVTNIHTTINRIVLYQKFLVELKILTERHVILLPSFSGLTVGGLWRPQNDTLTLANSCQRDRVAESERSPSQQKAIFGLFLDIGRDFIDKIYIPN